MNLLAAFLLGLAGSLHCAAMCGPLVVAVNAARGRNGLVHNLAYHGGRLFTYGVLGAISGLIGGAIVFAGFQRGLSTVAGCLILFGALASLRKGPGGIAARVAHFVKTKFGPFLRDRTLGSAVILGGLNGLLPCGMVYVACAAAATAAGVAGGIAVMLAFGVGTVPMLLSVGLAGKALGWGNPLHLRRAALVSVTIVGALLIVRGLSLGIPYLSPDFSGGHEAICGGHHSM
jgi:sulfite exporter TauE/SafE